jgi:hypothetical protein
MTLDLTIFTSVLAALAAMWLIGVLLMVGVWLGYAIWLRCQETRRRRFAADINFRARRIEADARRKD